MIPFINQSGAVFKKWITVEKGAKISGGVTITVAEENAAAILADGDCELNGDVIGIKKLVSKQIVTGELQAKEIQLGGHSLNQKINDIEDEIRTGRNKGDQDIYSANQAIGGNRAYIEAELHKFANQMNADRSYNQDTRRAMIAQADKDRSENFTAHENIVAKINEEKSSHEKAREELHEKINKLKDEFIASTNDIENHQETQQTINEDAHKLILEKLARYRTNTNATHEEIQSRLSQVEGVLTNTDPNAHGLVISPIEANQNIYLAVRNADGIVKKMVQIDGSPEGFGQITVNSKLLLKEQGAVNPTGADKGKDILATLNQLEKHLAHFEENGQGHVDTFHATTVGHKVGLSVTASAGADDTTRIIPALVVDYDSVTAKPLVGINTTEPKAEFHVNGDAKIEGDTHLQKNLFVTGEAKYRGNLQLLRNFYLTGDAKLKGNLQMQKSLYVQGETKLTGLLAVQNTFEVAGDSRFDNDIHVKGNIITYTDNQQDNVPLQNRIRELENEVAYLKKALTDLKKDDRCEGSIKHSVKTYYEDMQERNSISVENQAVNRPNMVPVTTTKYFP